MTQENAAMMPEASPTKILLAEDDAANALVASEILRLFDYQVDTVAKGADAVTKAKTGLYDIIIMDMRLLDMTGIDATREIREYEKQTGAKRIPIICVTASVFPGEAERCKAAGMDDFVSKPYHAEEFVRRLAKFAPEQNV